MKTQKFRISDASIWSPGWEDFKLQAPVSRSFNHLIAGSYFERRFQRWPLPPSDSKSTINDYIFAQMIDFDWTPLQLAFVDKELAKIKTKDIAPYLRVPETLHVIRMDDVPTVEDLHRAIAPFVGTNCVAKPTHGSGAVTFLRDIGHPQQLGVLHRLAAIDYSQILREMQYRGLAKKIIIEALIPTPNGTLPDDYKFHCVRGEPLLCQVDHNRFSASWSRLLRVDDLEPFFPGDGFTTPAGYERPGRDRMEAMVAAARALAAPFEFVRVDLYNGTDGVYFGELTFSPAASLGIAPSSEGDHFVNRTHLEYSRVIMRALKDP